MKTTYFKDFKSGHIECFKTYQNSYAVRVYITVSKENSRVHIYPVICGDEVISLNKGAVELNPTEALEELETFIEEIKRLTGYKSLQRQLSGKSEPQAAV